jgi:hypothetical protein
LLNQLKDQPQGPSADEWIKKIWNIYTVEYYSAMKKNEILPFAAKWMEMEDTMINKTSQTQKHKCHMFSLTCGS